MGPTACGKTDVALQLVKSLPIEIISVDSAMVYRGMDIGTAKPSPAVLASIPHHLINIRDPWETYSAADFCIDAKKSIEDILSRGKIPFLVGGTMLYFKALQQGLSVLPSADPIIREKIHIQVNTYSDVITGWQALHQELQRIDPKAAARIHPNDPQRIERALEVYYITGKTLSEHYHQQIPQDNLYQYVSIALFPEDRALLHERIAIRFNEMLAAGWIDEVIALQKLLPNHACLSLSNTIGYREICDYLSGNINKKTLIEKGIIATRQLAKRQMTWLRHWPQDADHLLHVLKC